MHDTNGPGGRNRPVHRPDDESGIIVFGGGGGGRGCAGRERLFWIVVSVVLSVTLTAFANLVLLLFSGGGFGVIVCVRVRSLSLPPGGSVPG